MRKAKTKKTVSLLVERMVDGNYIREYQTFTLKEYERMLKLASNIENTKSNSPNSREIKGGNYELAKRFRRNQKRSSRGN